MKDFLEIGRIISTHGLEGALVLQCQTAFLPYIQKGAFIFLELSQGTPVPFQITKIQKSSISYERIITFKRVSSVDDAKQLNGKKVWLKDDQVRDKDKVVHLHRLLQYTIVDTSLGTVGVIIDIIERPHQRLAIVHHQDDEIIIPLAEDFINSIQHDERIISMTLPDGLISQD